MKTHLKHLLGLALMVLVLAGCSNPAGPKIPEVNEPPVVETPEDNVKLTKVEFKWGTKSELRAVGKLKKASPRYLLGLRFDDDKLVYDYPKGYTKDSYTEFKKTVDFENFYKETLEEVFNKKEDYKKGDKIDLTQWTSEAIDLVNTTSEKTAYSYLSFSTEDIKEENVNVNFLDEVEVDDKDIIIYVYWNYFYVDN